MTQATKQPNFAALAEIAISWQARNGDGLAGFCCKLTSEEEVLLFLAPFLCHKSYDVNGKLEKSMLRAGSIGPKVAVIGGGFSGAAIAARLLRSRQVNVDVIEERPRLGLGLAYGDAQDGQILNVPAGRMSFWAEQPAHFLDWTKLRGPQLGWPEAGAATVESYLPRRLYGCYVADVMDAVAKKADIRIEGELVHYRNRAIALDQIAGGYRVTLADGQSINAAAVVILLATISRRRRGRSRVKAAHTSTILGQRTLLRISIPLRRFWSSARASPWSIWCFA
ncbi:MAG: FAD/NAD(P)-binding protein [Roseiarcus sp.]